MTRTEAFQAVRETVAAEVGVPSSEIRASDSLESLGIDSLGAISIIYDIEEELHIAIPKYKQNGKLTIKEAAEMVECD